MQAARAARRKAKILASADTRLAAVGGEPLKKKDTTRRLVLEDEDPALAPAKDVGTTAPSTAPAPGAAAAADSVSDESKPDATAAAHTYDKGYDKWNKFDVDAALAKDDDDDNDDDDDGSNLDEVNGAAQMSSGASKPRAVAKEGEEKEAAGDAAPADPLDEALEHVFRTAAGQAGSAGEESPTVPAEEAGEGGLEGEFSSKPAVRRARPARRKVPYEELEAAMAAPTPAFHDPTAPAAQSGSERPGAKRPMDPGSGLGVGHGSPGGAKSKGKAKPPAAAEAAAKPSSFSAAASPGKSVRRFWALVASPAFLVACLPVLLGVLLGLGLLRVETPEAGACLPSPLGSASGNPAADAARAKLEQFMGASSGAAPPAGSGAAAAPGQDSGENGGPLAVLTRLPIILIIFAWRLALTLAVKLRAGGLAGGGASPAAAGVEGAPGANGLSACSGPLAVLAAVGGGGGDSGGGGVLGLLSTAMATWALAKDLVVDTCAVLFSALGVLAIGRVARVGLAVSAGHCEPETPSL